MTVPEEPMVPNAPAETSRNRAERAYGALARIEQRHAATPQARARQALPHMTAPHEAVRLVTMLASGSLVPAADEPAVDPEDLLGALTLLPLVRGDVDAAELSLMQIARGRGLTWAQIASGQGLGSAQAAQQRFERLQRRGEAGME